MSRHGTARSQVPLGSFAAIVLAICLAAGRATAQPADAKRPAAGNASETNPPLEADHAAQMAAGRRLFRQQVRSVLTTHCLACHGGKTIKGDLDLSTRERLLSSGFLQPGEQESHLLAVIRHEEEPFMPHERPELPAATIELLQRWVQLGAPYDRPLTEQAHRAPLPRSVTAADRRFWSFQPLRTPAHEGELVTADSTGAETSIDHYLLDALTAQRLSFADQADRRTLVRRAYLDLLGIPPTPADVARFLADDSPAAWARLIDRLLDRPEYGERWARHWMDVARFAESSGFEHDDLRPGAYHYRDFLIRAFNDDMPFDRFVAWQVAGDELAYNNSLALAATGFLGAGVFPSQLTEAEFESARYDELDDMVATLGVAVLGLSVGCARCHDHKYDPIPSSDYYRLVANFTKTIRSDVRLGEDTSDPILVCAEGYPKRKHHADGRGFPHFYPQTYELSRGDVHQKKRVAVPGYLQVLMPPDGDTRPWRVAPPAGWKRSSFDRASLANWLTDTQAGAGNLVARVIVNRLWQHHFGAGIVATANDFGHQGTPPTHPQLLDFLAAELIRSGWHLKPIHRQIMLSRAYRQQSRSRPACVLVDPDNRLLWRMTPRRLDAEVIRDSILAVSGRLEHTMYGPGSLDEQMRRRSVYFTIKRSQLIPSLLVLDWPEHLVSIGRRAETTTAPQALLLLNGRYVRAAARNLASSLPGLVGPGKSLPVGVAKASDHPGDSQATRANEHPDGQAIRWSFEQILSRPPTPAEHAAAAEFVRQQESIHRQNGCSNARHEAWIDFCQSLLCSNEFAFLQ